MSERGHHARTVSVSTSGRGAVDISARVQEIVAESTLTAGLCNVFIHHTSASLMICENADPSVLTDLERFMARLVPDGDDLFRHVAEGPDDMPAHVRSILTQASLTVPIASGRLALGTWQGIFLWEHRHDGHRRRVTISVMGS